MSATDTVFRIKKRAMLCGDIVSDEPPSAISLHLEADILEVGDIALQLTLEVPGCTVLDDEGNRWDVQLVMLSLREIGELKAMLDAALAEASQLKAVLDECPPSARCWELQ